MSLLSIKNQNKEVYAVRIEIMHESGIKSCFQMHDLPKKIRAKYDNLKNRVAELLKKEYGDFRYVCFTLKEEKGVYKLGIEFETSVDYYLAVSKIKPIDVKYTKEVEIEREITTEDISERMLLMNKIYTCIEELNEVCCDAINIFEMLELDTQIELPLA